MRGLFICFIICFHSYFIYSFIYAIPYPSSWYHPSQGQSRSQKKWIHYYSSWWYYQDSTPGYSNGWQSQYSTCSVPKRRNSDRLGDYQWIHKSIQAFKTKINFMKKILSDFLFFIYKQAFACLFWAFILLLIIWCRYYYPLEWSIYQYDFLFIAVVVFQLFLVLSKYESYQEVWIIMIFHFVAMIMEIFKTHPSIWSWSYPWDFFIGIYWVPLFAGFMYSAVGSYITRVWKIFEFRYSQYPKKIYTVMIALAIYINFFTHHFIFDVRYIIIIAILATFWRTKIYFKPNKKYYSMNLAFWFSLVALFIWFAENIATYMRIWIYPSQSQVWHMVGIEKITAWFLLMIISFVLVSFLHKPKTFNK